MVDLGILTAAKKLCDKLPILLTIVSKYSTYALDADYIQFFYSFVGKYNYTTHTGAVPYL